ncbi:MAG: hypothetical protein K2J70_05420 [Muribaculaceae bacterium]|nr:hypothetical protein [Muribaculaceae bacterium]
MTKSIYTTIIIVFLMLFAGKAEGADSYRHTFHYSAGDLRLVSLEKEGTLYTEIGLGHLPNSGEPGEPDLPCEGINISVPNDAVDFTITTAVKESEIFPISGLPMPAQYPVPTSINAALIDFVHLDITKATQVRRQVSASIDGVTTIGGFNRTLSVSLCPVVWNVASNAVELATEIEVAVSWRHDASSFGTLLIPRYAETQESAMSRARESVVNPEDVEANAMPALGSRPMAAVVSQSERATFAIITTKALAGSLERLAALRRMRGFSTRIFCVEDILADSRFAAGDVESGYNDEAGKIRAFLRYAYSSLGTEYVLLAGPYEKLPGRWMREHEDYISDFYFRNLTAKWTNPTGRYPYSQELNDFGYDLNVGRITCSTYEEIDNYINKMLQYEFNTNNMNLSYLDDAYVLLGYDSRMKKRYDSYSKESYVTNFKNLKVDSDALNGPYYGSQAIISLNSGLWGFVDWRTHGHYSGIGTYYKEDDEVTYGVNALDSHRGWLQPENNNGLDNWNNKNYPCWTVSMSCLLAELGYNRGSYNFAQSFILGKDYGGIAFLGNTGSGLIDESSWLNEVIIQDCISRRESGIQVGYSAEILNTGLSELSLSKPNNKYLITTFCLNGDPLVPLWINQPYKSDVNGKFKPESISSTSQVWYAMNSFASSNTMAGIGKISGYSNVGEQRNSTMLNFRSDMLPFLHPTLISGLTVNDNNYWFMGKTRFGGDSSKGGISVSISANKEVTIEALDKVTVGGKLELNEGSKLKIKPHRSVSMSDCSITNKGHLEIETHSSVSIEKGSTISKGTKLTIIKER